MIGETPLGNLHCGACLEKFGDVEELSRHLQSCVTASLLLPLVRQVYFGVERTSKVGHPIGRFLWSFPLAVKKGLIKKYAYAVADGANSLDRAKIHAELCQSLDLDYHLFKPFESEEIKKIPNRGEAEEILLRAIFETVNK